jgi:hypothetical protein
MHVPSSHGQTVLVSPLEHLEVAADAPLPRTSPCPTGIRSRAPTAAPRGGPSNAAYSHVSSLHGAAVLACPLQHLEVPPHAANAHVSLSHGQPFSWRHFSTSRWPFHAATCTSARPTGQPFARAHSSILWSPRFAAYVHVHVVPTGIRSRAPTRASCGRRASPLPCTSTCSTRSRSRATTSARRGGRPSPRTRTSTRSTRSRSRAPTSAWRGGRHTPRSRTSPRPTGSRSRVPHCSTSRWPPFAAYAHVCSSHWQSFARAHLSTSRWPPAAA